MLLLVGTEFVKQVRLARVRIVQPLIQIMYVTSLQTILSNSTLTVIPQWDKLVMTHFLHIVLARGVVVILEIARQIVGVGQTVV